ncbi:hypothetical protein [Saccharothrix yanglingensis]|uniref:Uncharacterized protein n=1 Tax=Saccharothrix yanglingensis TaxID=659496 RepID=A0ABU0WYY8_9PSEU|nr:hypothetical protein [Saccharothrix yanglingensis]MDQ2584982.1 hypothetical protein [Saccharothrix yanglingensis]
MKRLRSDEAEPTVDPRPYRPAGRSRPRSPPGRRGPARGGVAAPAPAVHRRGRLPVRDITAALRGEPTRPYSHRGLGAAAPIGHPREAFTSAGRDR